MSVWDDYGPGALFGGSGGYDEASKQYERWNRKSEAALNPFIQAGQGAIPDYQNWLAGMKDPSKFINDTMGQYQESPWARYQKQQSEREGINAGSAGGMVGSTPWAQQMQQNAAGISSQDMQNWLARVLGINSEYGGGLGNMMQGGLSAGGSLAGMYGNMGQHMGDAAGSAANSKRNQMMQMLMMAAMMG